MNLHTRPAASAFLRLEHALVEAWPLHDLATSGYNTCRDNRLTQGHSHLPHPKPLSKASYPEVSVHGVPFREILCWLSTRFELKPLSVTIDEKLELPMGPETRLQALTPGPWKYSNESQCPNTLSPHPDPHSFQSQASTGKIGLSSKVPEPDQLRRSNSLGWG